MIQSPHMSSQETLLTHQATWVVDPGLPIFQDHFPGMPIVPAYLQLARIREEISYWLQRSSSRIKIKGMKYKQQIPPGREVLISLQREALDGLISVTVSLDGEVVTSGQLVLV